MILLGLICICIFYLGGTALVVIVICEYFHKPNKNNHEGNS